MKLLGSKKLEASRLILRPTEESDLKVLWSILLKPEINKYYLTSKLSTDWESEKVWQYKKLEKSNNKDVFQWSIILKDNNSCIGQISVQEGKTDDLGIRDIGWFIDLDYQRKGLSTEAASAILDYMFNEVGISKIITSAAICNPSSWRLMEKLGFKREEGTIFNKYNFLTEEVECYIYSIEEF